MLIIKSDLLQVKSLVYALQCYKLDSFFGLLYLVELLDCQTARHILNCTHCSLLCICLLLFAVMFEKT